MSRRFMKFTSERFPTSTSGQKWALGFRVLGYRVLGFRFWGFRVSDVGGLKVFGR